VGYLGLVASFIGSKIVIKRGDRLILDIILRIVGTVVGEWLFRNFGAYASGVTGLNIYSLAVAVVGAIVVLLVYHAVRPRNLTRRSRLRLLIGANPISNAYDTASENNR
jgi:uncharacterized membrane protein YeaQ/YmgE (transglycosylase-associated protein family)